MAASDDEIDYLLSGGGLGGQQLERIHDRLAGSARAQARALRRTMLAVTAAGAIAAAAAAVVILPRATGDPDTMRAKGSAVRPSPVLLHVACLGGSLSACPRGSVLGFSVGGTDQPGFVTAFADPLDGAGDRVWYFADQPLASGRAAPASGDRRVLASGAWIGGEHTARRYRIHVLLSSRPIGRDRAAAVPPAREVIAYDLVDLQVAP